MFKPDPQNCFALLPHEKLTTHRVTLFASISPHPSASQKIYIYIYTYISRDYDIRWSGYFRRFFFLRCNAESGNSLEKRTDGRLSDRETKPEFPADASHLQKHSIRMDKRLFAILCRVIASAISQRQPRFITLALNAFASNLTAWFTGNRSLSSEMPNWPCMTKTKEASEV